MSLKITSDCINCGACLDECPESAIFEAGSNYKSNGATKPPINEEFYFIVPEKCTECKDIAAAPKCIFICPMNCIEVAV